MAIDMKALNFALVNIENSCRIAEKMIKNIIFNAKIKNNKTEISYAIHNLLRDNRVNVIITIGGADFKQDSITI